MVHLITAYLLIAQVRSFTQLNEAGGDRLAWQIALLKWWGPPADSSGWSASARASRKRLTNTGAKSSRCPPGLHPAGMAAV